MGIILEFIVQDISTTTMNFEIMKTDAGPCNHHISAINSLFNYQLLSEYLSIKNKKLWIGFYYKRNVNKSIQTFHTSKSAQQDSIMTYYSERRSRIIAEY